MCADLHNVRGSVSLRGMEGLCVGGGGQACAVWLGIQGYYVAVIVRQNIAYPVTPCDGNNSAKRPTAAIALACVVSGAALHSCWPLARLLTRQGVRGIMAMELQRQREASTSGPNTSASARPCPNLQHPLPSISCHLLPTLRERENACRGKHRLCPKKHRLALIPAPPTAQQPLPPPPHLALRALPACVC